MGMHVKKGRLLPWQVLPGLLLLLTAAFISACGTLDIAVEDPSSPVTPTTGVMSTSAAEGSGPTTPAVAWYGTVHSVPGGDGEYDYFKPWHLAIWPKFGPAVGLDGADPAVDAEIDRLRDKDIKATFWGDLTCDVGDYGGCRLLVARVSADDGGPAYEPDRVEGWTGRASRLPAQPGSPNELLYLVLDGQVTALYGIAGSNEAIQAELEQLATLEGQPDGGATMQIWGVLDARVQLVTGSRITAERLEVISP